MRLEDLKEKDQPDRGRRAWDLLRREWGRAITDALWRGEHVQVLAKNGHLYDVWLDQGRSGVAEWSIVRLRNLTTGHSLCAQMVSGYEYPVGDRVFTVLEHLRLDPDHVERTANHTPDPTFIYRRLFRALPRMW